MKMIPVTLAMMAVVASASAQERAAGGTFETQMTWSALSAKIDTANKRVDGVEARMNQNVLCGKQSKFYAPETPGADGQGCLPVNVDFSKAACSLVSAGAPNGRNGCPAGTTRMALGASAQYGRSGGGSSNAGEVFQGVTTTYGCMKIMCK